MKIIQISIEVNQNSVGRIAEQIGEQILSEHGQSYITYARGYNTSKSEVIKIGNLLDLYYHGIQTRLFDTHCLHSKKATKNLIKKIDEINPDIVHLHHIHGYYINMEILFDFLRIKNYPVVWTFHDCWAFTGHCAFFDTVNCDKWKTKCYSCELKTSYPGSYFKDHSSVNYELKRKFFNSLGNLTIVSVSDWLNELVKQSFLKNNNLLVIKNGIDLSIFKPIENIVRKGQFEYETRKIILGVASTWDERKGLNYFIELDNLIDHTEFVILLIGLSKKQISKIPKSIKGMQKTESLEDLVYLYNIAFVLVNPTTSDTYPTVNLESIACGTKVITFNTGGSVENINADTGIITNKNNAFEIALSLDQIEKTANTKKLCRQFALKNFNKDLQFNKYLKLYGKIITNSAVNE